MALWDQSKVHSRQSLGPAIWIVPKRDEAQLMTLFQKESTVGNRKNLGPTHGL